MEWWEIGAKYHGFKNRLVTVLYIVEEAGQIRLASDYTTYYTWDINRMNEWW